MSDATLTITPPESVTAPRTAGQRARPEDADLDAKHLEDLPDGNRVSARAAWRLV